MNADEKRAFAELLTAALELYNKTPAKATLTLWWQTLERFEYQAVATAFSAYIADQNAGRFPPTPAGILAHLNAADGRPDSDEAWSIALESFDEARTICVTPEILEARSIAAPIMDAGDKIGARMAFRAAYDRAVKRARGNGDQARWSLSLGHDSAQREPAIRRAVDLGRLGVEQASKLLPSPKPEGAGAYIAGLLSGKVAELPNIEDARARKGLQELRGVLAKKRSPSKPAGDKRLENEERKRKMLDALVEKRKMTKSNA